MTPSWSGRQTAQALYNRLWGAGFLPSRYSGVGPRRKGDPVLYLSNPDGVSDTARRRILHRLAKMNQQTLDSVGDPETPARIAQYEMAFRMKTSMPDLMSIDGEPKNVLEMYGPEVTNPGTFAASWLVACWNVTSGLYSCSIAAGTSMEMSQSCYRHNAKTSISRHGHWCRT